MSAIEVAVAAPADLGECPLWSPEEERLYWVDIEGASIHRFDPLTGQDEVRSLPGRPGSLARTSMPGRLLVAMEHEAVWFDWASGSVTPWVELEASGTGNRLNDGRTDPAGRFWVGSMFERPAEQRFAGHLHRVEPSGTVATVRHEIGVTNGLAFDPARRRMYFADTLRDTVWCYDYDVETGTPTNERVFIDFTHHPGHPDGACVDADGGYWVAAVYGWAVLRFTPDGALDRRIDLPVQAPTMPAFGGAGADTLFVTSIGTAGSRTMAPSEVPGGVLLAVDAGVGGEPDAAFAASGA